MIMVTADLWEHKSITCVRGACSRFGGGKYCHFSLRLKKKTYLGNHRDVPKRY